MQKQLLYSLTVVLYLYANADCPASDWLLDTQGDAHYSRYNFTDVKRPYNGTDAWGEIKYALWPNMEEKTIGPYVTAIPTTTTESEFWWQRNCSGALGVQIYPMNILRPYSGKGKDKFQWFRGLRLYTTYGVREYYDKPSNADPEDEDFRIGFDYYNDNFLDKKVFTYLIWTNLTNRSTNYSLSDYDAVLWEGNVKLGTRHRFNADNSIFLPYAVIDWTVAPDHNNRWWENFVRAGVGVRLYPKVYKVANNNLERILQRFNIYAEVLHNASWIGDDAPNSVKETDWRIGINFSTFWD